MNIMFKFLNEKILISFALRYAQKKNYHRWYKRENI